MVKISKLIEKPFLAGHFFQNHQLISGTIRECTRQPPNKLIQTVTDSV
jgi:hypothetical protein